MEVRDREKEDDHSGWDVVGNDVVDTRNGGKQTSRERRGRERREKGGTEERVRGGGETNMRGADERNNRTRNRSCVLYNVISLYKTSAVLRGGK